MSLESSAGNRIHKAVRTIVLDIEIFRSKSSQRFRVAYCDFNGIHHKTSDVTYSCVSYDVFHYSRLFRTPACSSKICHNAEK